MKKWLLLSVVIIVGGFGLIGCTNQDKDEKREPINLEIKDGAYYINGEKTFINALGYEIAARPGQHPYKDEKVLEIARMNNDLKVIKEAGFNAVRTWSELTEEEVQLIQESGLMLVYGIWVLPDGNFDDPKFVDDAKQQVRNVMAWSKNYDCIITYLIMNEPMVAHVHEKGAKNTIELWKSLTAIIHEEHPGIPVTISNNSAIGDYLNERIFDVYGYNTYDYKEGLPGHTQGFANHFKYLKKLNGENKPVLVTEFGLSVSPIGYGMYGGNTRQAQAGHVIKNFSDLLDSEVAGICPFYYADGWWKADNPAKHDPYPEEWFGYWGYADENDTVGYPRPVWYEFKRYNEAILAAPRNQQIYQGAVPVEIYLGENVSRVKAIYNDKLIYNKEVSGHHFTDAIDFKEDSITDRELIFEFYNQDNELLKWESISLLTTKNDVELPKISLSFNNDDLSKVKKLETKITIENNSKFLLKGKVNYIFAHHEGWNPGVHKTKEVETDKTMVSFTDTFEPSENCYVLNVGAGVDIKYGKFVKRIHAEKLLYRGSWADAIKVD
ncbi:MAG: hypothetical protein PF517_07800 [Salinivirgaceae bacterium]|jgi:hypothetical protein|nr:hypothetical protein [Salinivirgaceae bacterium]